MLSGGLVVQSICHTASRGEILPHRFVCDSSVRVSPSRWRLRHSSRQPLFREPLVQRQSVSLLGACPRVAPVLQIVRAAFGRFFLKI